MLADAHISSLGDLWFKCRVGDGRRHLGKISVSVKLAGINYYIFIMQYRYSVPSRIQYNVKFV